MNQKPARSNYTILKQICEYVPGNLVNSIAKKYGVDKVSRSFKPWNHVVAMLYAQISHAISLNDICDALRNQRDSLKTIRGATPPSRNGLSNANKIRDAAMAEDLFWSMLKHLQTLSPNFGIGRKYKAFPRRFKRVIHAVDSTTIQLVANCMDWAKHRRRKAAAKCHMRLNLQTFLPSFAVVDAAKTHDTGHAREVCAGIKAGEIVVFDKAYIDFSHLFDLDDRGVFWVVRAKENMQYNVIEKLQLPKNTNILKDEIIELVTPTSKIDYPKTLRHVEAIVEIDGKDKVMNFITNNIEWAASSVCDLYKSRWGIETFFKEIKQTLQLCDFLGYSSNAVHWQIWIALLAYILIRFLAHVSNWKHSFTRLFTTIRALLWSRFSLTSLIDSYGTAHCLPRTRAAPEQAYFSGMNY